MGRGWWGKFLLSILFLVASFFGWAVGSRELGERGKREVEMR